MPRTIDITMAIRAEVADSAAEYGPHELADAVRFHLDLSDLDSIEADISAFTITGTREVPRPIQPGDLVEPHSRNLDPREVIAVGRDFLIIDIMGLETRVPKDNYVLNTPADGAL